MTDPNGNPALALLAIKYLNDKQVYNLLKK